MSYWCPAVGRIVDNCGERECLGSVCIRHERGVRPTETVSPSISLRQEVERLSLALLAADRDNAALRTENCMLGDKLARVVGCTRDVDVFASALDLATRIHVELAK